MKPVRKILFITLSNIGDVILSTPALEALHQTYPDAVIDIVGDARSDIVFRHCPYVGKVILKHKRQGWRGLLALVRQLRQQRYDLAVDLRTDGLLWLLRARRRLHKCSNRQGMHLHSAEKHFRSIAPIVGNSAPLPTKIWLSDAERTQARHLLLKFEGQRILALGAGANWPPKIWPAQHFAELANLLKDRFDAVLLLGGTQDQPRAAAVAEALQLPSINVCGNTDLLLSTALLEQADFFVGNDSGLGHLASAVGTPSMTVFGPGQPWRYRPWSSQALWLQDPQQEIANVSPTAVAAEITAFLDRAIAPVTRVD